MGKRLFCVLLSVENKYDRFHSLFSYYFDLTFPKTVITKKENSKNNWITEELKLKRIKNIQLTKEFRKSKTLILKVFLEKEKNVYRNELNKAKDIFFQTKINKSTNVQRIVWWIIDSEVGDKEKPQFNNITLTEQSKTVPHPTLISNIFNDHFVTFVRDLDSSNRETMLNNSVDVNPSNIVNLYPKFNLTAIDEIRL